MKSAIKETTQESPARRIKTLFLKFRSGCKHYNPKYYPGMPDDWTEHYCNKLPAYHGSLASCDAGCCPLIWKQL